MILWTVRYRQGGKTRQRHWNGKNAEGEAKLFVEKMKRFGVPYELLKSTTNIPRQGRFGRVLDVLQHGEIRFLTGGISFMDCYKLIAIAALVIYAAYWWYRGE